MKPKSIIGTILVVLLGLTGKIVGQGQKAKKFPMFTATPAMKAKSLEIKRMDKLAAAALDAGEYAKAEYYARQSLAASKASIMGDTYLAEALYEQGKNEEALKAYQVLARQGTDNSKELLPYSLLLLKTGQWAASLAAFNKALPGMGDDIEGDTAALRSASGHFSPTVPQPRELETAIHIALGRNYERWYGWTGRHSQDSKAMAEYHKAYVLSPDSALTQRFEKHRLGMQETQQRLLQKSAGYKAKPSGH